MSGVARRFPAWAVAATLLAVAAAPGVRAQVNGAPPSELQGVSLEPRLDQPLPLDLALTDEDGRRVTLREFFPGDRPVVLTLVYYRCPMLCGLVLEGLVEALRGMDWAPGRQFEVVSVSFDPRDTPTQARAKKQNVLGGYGRAEAAAGWHFLTGQAPQLRELTEAVGFHYRWLDDVGEFAHPATLILVTPDGRVARYVPGVNPDARTLRLSLVEAGEGKIGTAVDQFLLYCYRYDETKGSYAAVASRIMRLGGGVTVIVLGAVLFGLWRREARRSR